MFNFWARAGIATCSLARIQRGASARLALMTALLWEIFLISTGGLRKNAMTELCKTQNVHTNANHSGYCWKTTCYHIISMPCKIHTILRRNFLPMPRQMYTSELLPGNVKTKKCQRTANANLAPSCRSAVFSWGQDYFRNLIYFSLLGILTGSHMRRI